MCEELYASILAESGIDRSEVKFAIASGMITSEIGLIEIPHLVAPAGLEELSANIEVVDDPQVVDLGMPVYFIRGVRNNYGENVPVQKLREVDFMRGEEVQCIGILKDLKPALPVNIVILSSHTKIVHMNAEGKIAASITTMSGQIFEALKAATMVGKSIVHSEGEDAGGYTFEEIVDTACDCVENAGFVRTMFMPRFMQVLLKTNSDERELFVDAAIAMDDIKSFQEFERQGMATKKYILFGHEIRTKLYTYLMRKYIGEDVEVECIGDPQRIFDLTILGATITAQHIIQQRR